MGNAVLQQRGVGLIFITYQFSTLGNAVLQQRRKLYPIEPKKFSTLGNAVLQQLKRRVRDDKIHPQDCLAVEAGEGELVFKL